MKTLTNKGLLILMVIFNWSVALDYFKIFSVGGGWLYWWLFPRLIAGTFILLAGISFFIVEAMQRASC